MANFSLPLLGYGAARFTVEFFHQPDADKGIVLLDWMTMGHLPIGLRMGNRNFLTISRPAILEASAKRTPGG